MHRNLLDLTCVAHSLPRTKGFEESGKKAWKGIMPLSLPLQLCHPASAVPVERCSAARCFHVVDGRVTLPSTFAACREAPLRTSGALSDELLDVPWIPLQAGSPTHGGGSGGEGNDDSADSRVVRMMDLAKFDDKIHFYLGVQSDVAALRHTHDLGFVRVNAQPIKQAIRYAHRGIKRVLLSHLHTSLN